MYWGIRKQEEPQNVNSLGHPQNYLQQTPCVFVALVCGRRDYSSRLASSSAAHWFPSTAWDDEMWCCWRRNRRCSCPHPSFRGTYWGSWFGQLGLRKWSIWGEKWVAVAEQRMGRRRHISKSGGRQSAWFSSLHPNPGYTHSSEALFGDNQIRGLNNKKWLMIT